MVGPSQGETPKVHIKVGLGETLFMGIYPAVSDEQQGLLEDARVDDASIPTRFSDKQPYCGGIYSETTRDFLNRRRERAADHDGEGIVGTAKKVAGVLRAGGYSVELDEKIHPLAPNRYLFTSLPPEQ